ncbi:NADAR family protein [Streptomyces sp. NBC_01613]|uniref:NADAR family protein n=1 Tax=Streptomyces sp. NBC_01613 TaxID=2975896 RepID=UPI00386BFF1C
MTWRGPTHRTVDGERIDGVWCHVWRRHWRGEYSVDDLFVYADGAVLCEKLTDLAGLERMLDSGLIAVTDPTAPGPEEQPRTWRSRSSGPLTPRNFLLEVADRVEELAGRPTTVQRCWEAISRFGEERSEANRELLREAYLAIPAHLRIFVLGDMDLQDRPLRMLLTDLGEPVGGDGPPATTEMHEWALEYFRKGDEGVARSRERRSALHADDPAGAGRPPVVLRDVVYPQGWPERLGDFVLRNDYPARIRFAGDVHPSVLHGYWALSTAEDTDRVRVRNAPTAREAHELGGRAARRDDWPAVRLAVMAGLLRAKFTQHPDLAQILLATGDAAISYTGGWESPYWTDAFDDRGRNWMGRLLELTRAELLTDRLSWPTAE